MFKLVADLLMHGQLKFEKGRITLLEQRISMLPLYNTVEIQKSLEKLGQVNLLYFSNKKFGLEWTKKIYKSFKTKETEIFKWGINSVTLAGWGEVSLLENSSNGKKIRFKLEDSGIVEYYGESSKPVDHIFRGMIAGAMSATYNLDMDAIEVSCKAQGKESCEFLVMPAKNFDRTDKRIFQQLEPPN